MTHTGKGSAYMMRNEQTVESTSIPPKWKKRTAPEHIRPINIIPAFSHTGTPPIDWKFPEQCSSLSR